MINDLMNKRLREAHDFQKDAIAKGDKPCLFGSVDTLMDASHTREEAAKPIREIANLIASDYAKVPNMEFPLRYVCGPVVQLPSSASDAYYKRLNVKEVKLDAKSVALAIDLCTRVSPKDTGFMRRSSGIGCSGDDDLDRFVRTKREQALKRGLLFYKPNNFMMDRLYTSIFFRLEPKGKNKASVHSYDGQTFCWVNTVEAEGGPMAVLRPRPFYAHPYFNLGASALYQLIDKTKESVTTCPTLEVPIATSLSARVCSGAQVAFADVKRMGTCIPYDMTEAIANRCASIWRDITGVPLEYIKFFFDVAARVPRIRYPKDISWPVDYDTYIDREDLTIGNADGVGGTTFRNNVLMTYWILELYKLLNFPMPKSLDEISQNRVSFNYIGDTVLCSVKDQSYGTPVYILELLQKVIEKNSVDGSLSIETGGTDTWCGYRHVKGMLVVDEVASIMKILSPEYEPGSRMRPNPIAGFKAAEEKFRSIPMEYRSTSKKTVDAVLKIFTEFVDLDFQLGSDYTISAPDISVYFYDPNYVNLRPPDSYFINFTAQDIIQSVCEGYKLSVRR